MGDTQLPQGGQCDEPPLQHPLQWMPLLPATARCAPGAERVLRLRPFPHLRRHPHAAASRRSRHKGRITADHLSHGRRQIAHLPAACHHGRTQYPRPDGGHLALAVVDERPGGQPCRTRHCRRCDHQRPARPHRTGSGHRASGRRHSQPALYRPRDAPLQNHREAADGAHHRPFCHRRSPLFLGLGP